MVSGQVARAACVWLAAGLLHAAPLKREQVPEPLRPWVDWSLRGHEDHACALAGSSADVRRCAWPSRLALELDDRGGSFEQEWLLQRPGWVPLPGDGKLWPVEVRVNGAPVPVTAVNSVPGVELGTGPSQVRGRFEWSRLPQQLPVPSETGLLRLSLRGQGVDFPQRDAAGQLWLAKRVEEEKRENRVDVLVHRLVADDIPLQLVTRVQLEVSGQSRDELLGKALPAGFIPLALESPLPARLEPDGRLRVQVRPGTWVLELRARQEGPVNAIELPAAAGTWSTQEVWVLDARPALRVVDVEGVPPVDPQQTRLPDEWKRLPAYRVEPGNRFTLTERRRGDTPALPDQLSLQRQWTMDFDGRGFTVRDHLEGTLNQGWRLSMAPPMVLGRAAVDGQDQFITRLGATAEIGVEVRRRSVNVVADSRLDGNPSDIPAVGWNHDFHQVQGTLRLPPGWRLLHASGVDDAQPTWLKSWTLLDIFVVLLVVLAMGKLWGRPWGALALVTLVLCWQEGDAPQWTWPAVLLGEALVRVLPEGRLRKLLKAYRLGAVVTLVAITIPFLVQELRQGLYPALEKPWQQVTAEGADQGYPSGGYGGAGKGMTLPSTAMAEPPAPDMEEGEAPGRMAKMMLSADSHAPPPPPAPRLDEYDTKTVVQTGPGVPTWGWNTVQLRWSGPVEHDERLTLWLTGPATNFLLALLRVLLVALLVLCAVQFPGGFWPSLLTRSASPRPALWALPWLLLLAAPARAQAVPPKEVLEELQARLLESPACLPECASLGRLVLDAAEDTLRVRLEVDAAADVAVPLPGSANQWTAQSILVDGAPARGVARTPDGRTQVWVPRGKHQVLLEGRLPPRETVQLPLPLRPHHVSAQVRGWTLDGVHEGLADEVLQLTRLRRAPGATTTLEPGTLAPFVRVHRELSLGLSWTLRTRVERVSPLGAAVVVEVPLLSGERVTTADLRVQDNRALVTLGPQAAEVAWASALDVAPAITLQAPAAVPWTEVWSVEASPIWHLDVQGIPTVQGDDGGQRVWWPWPGESVRLSITRPEGVGGQTLTVDRVRVQVQPGARATDVTLDFAIRTSRGGPHLLTLPEGAQLQDASFHGVRQLIRQENSKVSLPLSPGSQDVQLRWRQGNGMADRTFVYQVAPVDLGVPAVNVETVVNVPANRWVLFLEPTQLGPAVLFWSLLAVLFLAALALGRIPLTPLRWHHWFLLALGLTQASVPTAMLVAGWLLALGWRQKQLELSRRWFNLRQVLLLGWSVAALVALLVSVEQGLLGTPDMQITGNGSSAEMLRWYADRAAAVLPQPWVVSVPLWCYRVAMLAWALWLAFSLLKWLRWAYACLGEGGLWNNTAPASTPAAPRPGTGAAQGPATSAAPGSPRKDG